MNLENRNFITIVAMLTGILSIMLIGFFNLTIMIHRESKDFHQESKDFHGRLCILEARYLDIKEKELDRRK